MKKIIFSFCAVITIFSLLQLSHVDSDDLAVKGKNNYNHSREYILLI